jgi:hypothetical protein
VLRTDLNLAAATRDGAGDELRPLDQIRRPAQRAAPSPTTPPTPAPNLPGRLVHGPRPERRLQPTPHLRHVHANLTILGCPARQDDALNSGGTEATWSAGACGFAFGAQLIGHYGAEVAKRVDTLATAISFAAQVDDLAKLDLSYTPPLGSPFDPIQHAADAWTRHHTTVAATT